MINAVAEFERAEADGTSVNQFIALAVAEKVAALAAEREFARRAAAANLDAFDKVMGRDTPEPDIEEDRLDAKHGPVLDGSGP